MSVTQVLSAGAGEAMARNPDPGAWCKLHGQAMGTTWTINMSLAGCTLVPATLRAAIQAVLDRICRQMSNWDEDSTLSALNRADTGWYRAPDELFHVVARALDIARQTAGAYDPTLGRLNDLWGFGPAGPITAPPADHDIDAALAQSGYERTAVDNDHQAIWQPGGLHFDLSSIGKGYAVDAVSGLLDKHHVGQYLVEIGGELRSKGLNAQGSPWRVAIEAPATDLAAAQASAAEASGGSLPVELKDGAIATSGDYRRYFEHEGRRYAHTLDPASGKPVVHSLVSVSVLHRECMMADGLSTALFSMGDDKGFEYARARRIPALFLNRLGDDIQLRRTAAFDMACITGQKR